jgi:hypothetical protein
MTSTTQGPLSIEWEDGGMDREFGAAESCDFVRALDFPPSNIVFDAQLGRGKTGRGRRLLQKGLRVSQESNLCLMTARHLRDRCTISPFFPQLLLSPISVRSDSISKRPCPRNPASKRTATGRVRELKRIRRNFCNSLFRKPPTPSLRKGLRLFLDAERSGLEIERKADFREGF